MANSISSADLIQRLASKNRVVLLGGLAVVSHGLSRPTFDADVWLDPRLEPASWAEAVLNLKKEIPGLKCLAIAVWNEIPDSELAEIIERDGVIRVMGASQPIDIFRKPNELPIEEFDAAWNRAVELKDGTRLPDEIDLLMTKQLTDRAKDAMDIQFLEMKAEGRYLAELPSAPEQQAVQMLERFLTPKIAEAALAHSSETVRDLGLRFLQELTADGDPFAAEILKTIES
jgi:hypothetical protein